MHSGIRIDLSERKTLITGATRGIGKAIAQVFEKAGSKMILTGTNRSVINELNKKEKNKKIIWEYADFSTAKGIKTFIKNLDSDIDICVNNAGINVIKPFNEYSSEEYEKVINVNQRAAFEIIKKLILSMQKNSFGRIVNVASIWSHIGKPHRSLYSMSKTGLVGLTRSLAIEYAENNILANSISPGFINTELTKKSLSKVEISNLNKQIPISRLGSPDEIAYVILFLCSDLNTYLTGQNIIIDGGFTIV